MPGLNRRLGQLENAFSNSGAPTWEEVIAAHERMTARASKCLVESLQANGVDCKLDERHADLLINDSEELECYDKDIKHRWCVAHGVNMDAEATGAKEKLIERIERIAERRSHGETIP